MIGRLFLRALVLLAVLAPLASAQLKDICFTCKGQGWLPCTATACKTAKVCGIKLPHQCDQIWAQPCCHGIQKIVCDRCHDPVAEAEIKAETDRRMEWVNRMTALDSKCGIKASHVETERWKVHWTIPSWKIGDEEKNRHKAAHIFAERLDECGALIERTLGGKTAGKQTMFMVATADEQMKTTLAMQGAGKNVTHNTYAPEGLSVIRPEPGKTHTDDLFHGACIHNAAHIGANATGPQVADFYMKVWLDEAFAHWIEIEKFKRPFTFCVHEVRIGKDTWENADWKKLIYAELGVDKQQSFGKLITQELDKANGRDRAYNWSYIDFLIKTRPEDFKKFFTELKTTRDTKKALKAAFGWSTAILEEKWKAYVLKTYAP